MALPLFAVLDAKRGLLDVTLGRETLIIPRFRCIIPMTVLPDEWISPRADSDKAKTAANG